MTSPRTPTDPPADAARVTLLAACDDALASGVAPPLGAADDDVAFLQLLDQLRPPGVTGSPRPELETSPLSRLCGRGAGGEGAVCEAPSPPGDPLRGYPAPQSRARGDLSSDPLDDSGRSDTADGPRYILRGLHAEGGIGQVWLAFDTELGRDVALKVLRPERVGDAGLAGRFMHEARVTARLQHPGIVPVYDLAPGANAGDGDEPPFYTMRLVGGRTLTEAIRAYHDRRAARTATPVERATLLNAFVGVCHAVAYAHSQGVVHRDLKPDNVALGDYGEVVVLDWGFAKQVSGVRGQESGVRGQGSGGRGQKPESGLTPDSCPLTPASCPLTPGHSVAGQVLGTPAYMAPEQAAGGAVDERTDVYGLGAILYELLTGRPPYAGSDTADVLRQVRAGPPPRPRAVAPRVPPALEAVCLTALARDPAGRYPSAAAVASDVQHWLADEPVTAFPEHVGDRLRRWARRHRPVVAGATALLLTGVLAGIVLLAVIREEEARTAEDRFQTAMQHAAAMGRAGATLEYQLYLNRIALAERTLAAHNPSRAIRLLDDCPPPLRGWEWHCLSRLCREDLMTLRGPAGHTGTVQAVAFSPDGRTLASAGFDGTVKLWDLATGRHRLTYAGHGAVVYDVAFAPDGRHVATAGWDGTVQVWEAATGRVVHVLRGHEGQADRVAYSPDGRRLYTMDIRRTVRVWDAATAALVHEHRTDWQATAALAVSPDGRSLVLGGWDGTVFIRDAATGAELGQLHGHRRLVRALAFSPDGSLLATGDGDIGRGDPGEVRVWAWAGAASRELHTFTGHTEPIFCLSFTPDNARLASASQDHTVKVWDLRHGQEALTLHADADIVRAAVFSPDGRRLATAGADRVVRVWDATPWEGGRSPRERQSLPAHDGRALAVAYRGRGVASVGDDRTLAFWDPDRPDDDPRRFRLASLGDAVEGAGWDYFALAFSPDGRHVATANSAGTVVVLDADTNRLVRALRGHGTGPIKGLAYRPGGRELATASWDRTVRVWDADTGRERLVLRQHTEPVLCVAYSPDGRTLASAGNDQTVRVWDADTGRELQVLRQHTSGVAAVAFSPTQPLLASAGNDGTVRLWNTTTWRERTALRGHASAVQAVAFSPDGRLLASAGDDWTVRVWRAADGEALATLRGHTDRVHGLAFSPDGRALASAGYDGAVKVWDVTGLGE